MILNPIEDFRGKENPYLDVTKLQEGNMYTKVALVYNADAGLTKTNSGFARFFLKDVNGNLVTARLFDVKDFAESGIKLSLFKNKPVELRFTAQLFNGSMSLIIDGSFGVKEWSGEIDRSRFIGKFDVKEDAVNTVMQKYLEDETWKFPVEYLTSSLLSIGQGRVGGFGKVFEMAALQLTAFTDISGIDAKELYGVFTVAMELYYRIKVALDSFGVLGDIRAFDIVTGINNMDFDEELRAMVLDAVKPFANLGEPKHIVSHVINRVVKQCENLMDLILVNNQLVVGASSRQGGALLSKF